MRRGLLGNQAVAASAVAHHFFELSTQLARLFRQSRDVALRMS